MSACRLVATIVSRVSRLERHAHGHGVDQHPVPGHLGIFCRDLARDLVPQHQAVALRVRFGDHRQRWRGLERASSNAKRMMRVTPARVKIATSVATSCGNPRCERPPYPAYSPSEFSRTITQSS